MPNIRKTVVGIYAKNPWHSELFDEDMIGTALIVSQDNINGMYYQSGFISKNGILIPLRGRIIDLPPAEHRAIHVITSSIKFYIEDFKKRDGYSRTAIFRERGTTPDQLGLVEKLRDRGLIIEG